MKTNLIGLSIGLAILLLAAVPFWGQIDTNDGHVMMSAVPPLTGRDIPEWAHYAIVEMFPHPNTRAKVVFSGRPPKARGEATWITVGHHSKRGRTPIRLQDDISWAVFPVN